MRDDLVINIEESISGSRSHLCYGQAVPSFLPLFLLLSLPSAVRSSQDSSGPVSVQYSTEQCSAVQCSTVQCNRAIAQTIVLEISWFGA